MKKVERETKKSEYRRPELTVYGDVRKLTLTATAGAAVDGPSGMMT